MFGKLKVASVLAAAVGLAAPAFGSTIATIEGDPSGTAGVSFGNTGAGDPLAVITSIGSYAGTISDGYTYTNWAMLANDGTGSIDVFGHLPTGSTYVPAVGEGISATGTYSPFNAIPEVDALTAISGAAGPFTVPPPVTVTIPQLNALSSSSTPSNFAIQEYLLALNDVTISQETALDPVPGNFPTHANGTYTITDGSSNSMIMYQYASSYSVAGLFGGTPVPTGLVDLTGIVDVFNSGTAAAPVLGSEFIPFSITAVPEPVSMGLFAVGAAAMLMRRRRTA